jgi:hypothetical protein
MKYSKAAITNPTNVQTTRICHVRQYHVSKTGEKAHVKTKRVVPRRCKKQEKSDLRMSTFADVNEMLVAFGNKIMRSA